MYRRVTDFRAPSRVASSTVGAVEGEREELVPVAEADDGVEAEMIQGLLGENGIPSSLQALGINGPMLGYGALPKGRQRVLVFAGQAAAARALLADTQQPDPFMKWELEAGGGRKPRSYGLVGAYARIWLVSFLVMGAAFLIFLLFHG
jgi:hypothetical protein